MNSGAGAHGCAPMKGFWTAALLAMSWSATPAATEAGTISISYEVPAVHWAIPSTRDRVYIYFRETDWHDTCPPELASVNLDGFDITVRFEVDPTSGCVPDPVETPYSDSAPVGRLATGTYDVVVEAPDFTTGEIEQTTATFEVVEAVQCGRVRAPAATLLLPYFEVDLEDPEGRTTLFSVANVEGQPVLAHAVLWTNWGNPALSFDFFVPADGVVSFNLRQVLLGELGSTSPPADPPEGWYESCTDPVTLPEVDAQDLRAVLTGQPHPEDGLCHSSAVEDGGLATGYVTVDVVRDCSGAELRIPLDPGYFLDGGMGLATNDNALLGDFHLVDPAEDSAQGETLVPLVADAETVDYPSFYRNNDNRMMLPAVLRARFLSAGIFDGTDLLIWTEDRTEPIACGSPHVNEQFMVEAESRSEQGEPSEVQRFVVEEHALRVRVGGELLPVEPRFGSIDIGGQHFQSNPGPPSMRLLQTWMMPIVSADGRFSAGLEGVPIEDFCR